MLWDLLLWVPGRLLWIVFRIVTWPLWMLLSGLVRWTKHEPFLGTAEQRALPGLGDAVFGRHASDVSTGRREQTR